jgi:RNA polymerase sigma-70 factor, ECF subfamily
LRQPEEAAGSSSDARAEDSKLVEACRAGDAAAFERLYELHGPRLKSLAWNLLGNAHDAEDAVQEVFLRVYRGIGNFRGKSSLGTWVYRILLNCSTDIRRRSARRREASGQEVERETLEAAAAPARDHPLRLSLEKSLGRLNPRQRSIFVLVEIEGFKHSEAAEILEISEMASRTILYEAKRTLRRLLFETGARP